MFFNISNEIRLQNIETDFLEHLQNVENLYTF